MKKLFYYKIVSRTYYRQFLNKCDELKYDITENYFILYHSNSRLTQSTWIGVKNNNLNEEVYDQKTNIRNFDCNGIISGMC
jgi:hypothetical protein